jgi:membrane-associated phospholipid phosphatase
MDILPQILIDAVTDMADSALLLPFSAVVFAWLVWAHVPRVAVGWVLAMLTCLVPLVLIKFGLHACYSPLAELGIRTPSGHAGWGTAFYGSLAVLTAHEKRGWWRPAALMTGAGLIAIIALSRLQIGAHTVPEVLIGLALGLASVAVFALTIRCAPRRGLRIGTVLAGMAAVGAFAIPIMLHYEWGLPTERTIQNAAGDFGSAVLECTGESP